MHDDFVDKVYLSLQGQLSQPLDGVESIFCAGSRCQLALYRMRDAYTRLCERLSVEDEDEDVEEIILAFMEMSEELGRHMYRCGHKFGGREI